jgi:2-desacetyl-2-hydroxyethyl bacteriochlorophyllide A dehydrogenase
MTAGESMRAIQFEGPGQIRMASLPLPLPEQGEARLRVLAAGICATDFHILQGHFSIRPPRVLGHELVGVVDAVGPGVSADWIGKTCGVSPARFCGHCFACRQGLPQLCLNFECLGNTQDGGLAEFTLVRLDQLVPVEPGQAARAVWLEPMACVMHAIQAAQVKPVDRVLILGAGVLGRLMIQALQVDVRAHIAVVDPNPEKVEQALALGAQAGWVAPRSGPGLGAENSLREWAPDGLQAIIDTTGSPEAIQNGLEWAGPGGRLVLFGVSDPQACLSLSPAKIFSQELTITATSGMTPDSFKVAKDLILSGRIDPSPLVSAAIDLESVPAELHERTYSRRGKVLVYPGGASR